MYLPLLLADILVAHITTYVSVPAIVIADINPETSIFSSPATAATDDDELEDSVESLEDGATMGALLAEQLKRRPPEAAVAAAAENIEDVPILMEALPYRRYPLHRFKQLLFDGALSDRELLITAYKQRHFRFMDLLTDRSWNLDQVLSLQIGSATVTRC